MVISIWRRPAGVPFQSLGAVSRIWPLVYKVCKGFADLFGDTPFGQFEKWERGSYSALVFLIGELTLNTGMRQGNCSSYTGKELISARCDRCLSDQDNASMSMR